MSYDLLRLKSVRGVRPRPCIWCGEQIPAGVTHLHEVSTFDGGFQDNRWHPECYAAADEAFRCRYYEDTFSPFDNERGEAMPLERRVRRWADVVDRDRMAWEGGAA